jgi:hypothetical protein
MAIVGVEGPQKNQLRACWGVTSPGSGASGPLLGEFLAYTPVFSREKTPSRGLKKISRSLGFSACSASALRCVPLPGLEGFVRVPAGRENYPVEALLFDVRLQLTAGGAPRMPIMIVREWDPAADGHRVGWFGPGPGVRRAAVATLFGSRPRSAASRRHVARPARRARHPRGAKALLRDVELAVLDVELAVLVDRLPEVGRERRSGYPTPWHWGVSELLTEFLDPVRRARTNRLGHRGLHPGHRGDPWPEPRARRPLRALQPRGTRRGPQAWHRRGHAGPGRRRGKGRSWPSCTLPGAPSRWRPPAGKSPQHF